MLNARRDKGWPPIKTTQSCFLSGARVPCPSFKTSYRCGGGMTAADGARVWWVLVFHIQIRDRSWLFKFFKNQCWIGLFLSRSVVFHIAGNLNIGILFKVAKLWAGINRLSALRNSLSGMWTLLVIHVPMEWKRQKVVGNTVHKIRILSNTSWSSGSIISCANKGPVCSLNLVLQRILTAAFYLILSLFILVELAQV